jgi:hypothetical protein
MARVNVYLPDELAEEARAAGVARHIETVAAAPVVGRLAVPVIVPPVSSGHRPDRS